jgi:hypothetical protein
VTWTTVADAGLPVSTQALITGIERGFAVAAAITLAAFVAAVIANPRGGPRPRAAALAEAPSEG